MGKIQDTTEIIIFYNRLSIREETSNNVELIDVINPRIVSVTTPRSSTTTRRTVTTTRRTTSTREPRVVFPETGGCSTFCRKAAELGKCPRDCQHFKGT